MLHAKRNLSVSVKFSLALAYDRETDREETQIRHFFLNNFFYPYEFFFHFFFRKDTLYLNFKCSHKKNIGSLNEVERINLQDSQIEIIRPSGKPLKITLSDYWKTNFPSRYQIGSITQQVQQRLPHTDLIPSLKHNQNTSDQELVTNSVWNSIVMFL